MHNLHNVSSVSTLTDLEKAYLVYMLDQGRRVRIRRDAVGRQKVQYYQPGHYYNDYRATWETTTPWAMSGTLNITTWSENLNERDRRTINVLLQRFDPSCVPVMQSKSRK